MMKNVKTVGIAVLFSIALMATYVKSVKALIFVDDYNYDSGNYSWCWAYVSGWWDIDNQIVYSAYHSSDKYVPPWPGWGYWYDDFPGNGNSAPIAYTHIFVGYLSGSDLYVDSEAWAWIPETPR